MGSLAVLREREQRELEKIARDRDRRARWKTGSWRDRRVAELRLNTQFWVMGTATEAGRVEFWISGEKFTVDVEAGDDAHDVQRKMNAAIAHAEPLQRFRFGAWPSWLQNAVLRAAACAIRALTWGIRHLGISADEEVTMLDGSPVTDDHRAIQPTGMQKGYVVLSEAERAKGYVRAVRASYVHDACEKVTTMAVPLAQTMARKPTFYSHAFCATCREHYPVAEFKWCGTEERVGS